jgi:hypothetical protein
MFKLKAIKILTSTILLEDDGNNCNKIVLGVKYVIFWSDGQVNRVLSRVIISDVPLGTAIKQMFEIVWANLPPTYDDILNFENVNTVEQYDNIISSLDFIESQRSGIYGAFVLHL